MTDTDLLFPITLTLQAAFSSLVLFAVIGVPLALYTARSKTRLSRAVLFIATLPLIFPPVALGYLLLLLLGINGPVGSVLHNAFGTRIVFSQTAVTLAAFIAGLPLVIRPVKEAFESKTLLDLECAARVCGATPMTTFLRVTLPTVRNAVLSAFLLGTARASGVKLAERKSSKFAMGDFYALLNRFHCQTLRSFAQYHSTLGETRLHPDRRQNVRRSSPL